MQSLGNVTLGKLELICTGLGVLELVVGAVEVSTFASLDLTICRIVIGLPTLLVT